MRVHELVHLVAGSGGIHSWSTEPYVRDQRAAQRAGVHVLLIALALVGLGLVMVYSSSFVLGRARFADPGFFLERQSARALIGIVLMLVLSRVPTRLWAGSARLLLVVGVGTLVLVLVAGEGPANRWLRIAAPGGSFSFQPSEFVKLALVLYLADVLGRKEKLMPSLRHGLLPRLLVVGIVVLLIAIQPDLGTAVSVGLVALTMLWLGGAKTTQLVAVGLGALPVMALSMHVSRYQLARVLAFWHGGNYQVNQALVALGSGGWVGVGLGNSLQKQQFLPEPHTDFVFALVGEELGLAGTLSVVALFVALAIQGLRIARQADTHHEYLLAAGITAMISLYALLNVGVVTGMLPTTGLPLPFISYGGSALIGNLAAVGILLSIARADSTTTDRAPLLSPTGPRMVRRFS